MKMVCVCLCTCVCVRENVWPLALPENLFGEMKEETDSLGVTVSFRMLVCGCHHTSSI